MCVCVRVCVCTQAEITGLMWLFGTGEGMERNEGLSALVSDHLLSVRSEIVCSYSSLYLTVQNI